MNSTRQRHVKRTDLRARQVRMNAYASPDLAGISCRLRGLDRYSCPEFRTTLKDGENG